MHGWQATWLDLAAADHRSSLACRKRSHRALAGPDCSQTLSAEFIR